MYLIFNEFNSEDEFTITDVRGRGILQNEIELMEVAGKAGAFFSKRRIPVRTIEVDVVIQGKDPGDLRNRVRDINKDLSVSEPQKLWFSDDPDVEYYGIPAESTEDGDIVYT